MTRIANAGCKTPMLSQLQWEKKMKTASAVYTQNIGVVGVVSKSLAGKPDKKVI